MQNELAQIERKAKLSTYDGEDKIVSSKELAALLKDAPKTTGIALGFPSLDKVLNNIEGGELVLISGPSGEGKSTLMRSITKNIAKQKTCLWFNLEDSNRQFLGRFDFNPPLFYMPSKNLENTVTWIRDRIDEAFAREDVPNPDIIFIDHLHAILSQMRFQGNLSMEIGDITQKIKDFATQHDVPVILGVHCRDLEEKSIKSYRKEHIRDSGLIVRNADTVILVWRVPNITNWSTKVRIGDEMSEKDTKAIVKIDKNRREGTLSRFFLNHTNHFFTEWDDFHELHEAMRPQYEKIIDDEPQEDFWNRT